MRNVLNTRSYMRAYQPQQKKCRRYNIIDNCKRDEWSGFADLLANLIEKYAAVLDVDNLPEPPCCLDSNAKEVENKFKLLTDTIDKPEIM